MPKERLDNLIVERNLVESRNQAQRLIMAGQVRVDGQMVLKAGTKISPQADIKIIKKAQYVSRGGDKLAAALEILPLEITGKVCADVGSSTGGFTDCLLQNGAKRVYAIDVGKGILHWKLRQDVRVVVLEETNARYLEMLPEPVDVITVDASFISLKKLLPVFPGWLNREFSKLGEGETAKLGEIIALIKPQFEAGRKEVSRGQGVIRDAAVHQRVLVDILEFALECGYLVKGLVRSPLTGPKGNIEFLAWMVYTKGGTEDSDTLTQDDRVKNLAQMTAEALV